MERELRDRQDRERERTQQYTIQHTQVEKERWRKTNRDRQTQRERW